MHPVLRWKILMLLASGVNTIREWLGEARNVAPKSMQATSQLAEKSLTGSILSATWQQNPKPLARNLVSQLVEYGTGAEISFADRKQVEAIVRRSKQSDYGVRTILKEVVSSPIFLTK